MVSRNFTSAELATFDGKSGRRAFVAFKGKVYDVTDSGLWSRGYTRGSMRRAGILPRKSQMLRMGKKCST